MTTYQVDMNQVEYIVGEMTTITQKIHETVIQLNNQSQNDLANWEASARDAYHTQKQIWDNASNDMETMLANATSALGQINEYYGNGERQGVNLWQG